MAGDSHSGALICPPVEQAELGRGPRAGQVGGGGKEGLLESVSLLWQAWAWLPGLPLPYPHFLQAQVKITTQSAFSLQTAEGSATGCVHPERPLPLPAEKLPRLTVDSENPQTLEPHNTFPAKKVAASLVSSLAGWGSVQPPDKVLPRRPPLGRLCQEKHPHPPAPTQTHT